ncbi:MAG TPA: hypothetical protein VFV52_10830 [Bacilli bacterium]|nr:hypothetical protein [Bacilli bacterium]
MKFIGLFLLFLLLGVIGLAGMFYSFFRYETLFYASMALTGGAALGLLATIVGGLYAFFTRKRP